MGCAFVFYCLSFRATLQQTPLDEWWLSEEWWINCAGCALTGMLGSACSRLFDAHSVRRGVVWRLLLIAFSFLTIAVLNYAWLGVLTLRAAPLILTIHATSSFGELGEIAARWGHQRWRKRALF